MSLIFTFISLISGAVIGAFLPDLEAIITALFVEPNHHTSQMIRSFYKDRKFKLLWFYWRANRGEYQSLIVHSSFFQLVFFVFSFYIVSSSASSFAGALCLALLARLFYEQYLDYKKGTLKEWFWAINLPLTKNFYKIYFLVLGVVYLYLLVNLFN